MTDKQQQFNEYFMVDHDFNINVSIYEGAPSDIDIEMLENDMPEAFKMAAELSHIDQSALRPLRGLGESAVLLAEFLNAQSRKINVMMGYILALQEKENDRETCSKLGGSGLVFNSDSHYSVGQLVELKVFLNDIAAAVYCYGEVIDVTPASESKKNVISVLYHTIREDDREVIVKASLHEQTKQLKKKSLAKQQQD